MLALEEKKRKPNLATTLNCHQHVEGGFVNKHIIRDGFVWNTMTLKWMQTIAKSIFYLLSFLRFDAFSMFVSRMFHMKTSSYRLVLPITIFFEMIPINLSEPLNLLKYTIMYVLWIVLILELPNTSSFSNLRLDYVSFSWNKLILNWNESSFWTKFSK